MHIKKASVSNQLLPKKGNILHNEFPTKIVLLILALHSLCNLKKISITSPVSRSWVRKNKPYIWKKWEHQGEDTRKTKGEQTFFPPNYNSSCASLWNVSEKGRIRIEVLGVLIFHYLRHITLRQRRIKCRN